MGTDFPLKFSMLCLFFCVATLSDNHTHVIYSFYGLSLSDHFQTQSDKSPPPYLILFYKRSLLLHSLQCKDFPQEDMIHSNHSKNLSAILLLLPDIFPATQVLWISLILSSLLLLFFLFLFQTRKYPGLNLFVLSVFHHKPLPPVFHFPKAVPVPMILLVSETKASDFSLNNNPQNLYFLYHSMIYPRYTIQ